MRWTPMVGSRLARSLDCRDSRGRLVGSASPDGRWAVYGIDDCPGSWGGRADPPTLDAAKAIVEAELWARAARALGA